jgi:RNA polymerase sigma-70 factor, ECF subfamily
MDPGSVSSPEPDRGTSSASTRGALFQLVYEDLRDLAGRLLKHERADHTLQATALVHEVYLRFVSDGAPDCTTRDQVLAAAVTAMRRVLINHAVARRALKRGDGAQRLALDEVVVAAEQRGLDLVALDEALTRLEALDPLQSRVVELRFFGHLTEPEAARVLAISERTLRREWTAAKAWLRLRLSEADDRVGSERRLT